MYLERRNFYAFVGNLPDIVRHQMGTATADLPSPRGVTLDQVGKDWTILWQNICLTITKLIRHWRRF